MDDEEFLSLLNSGALNNIDSDNALDAASSMTNMRRRAENKEYLYNSELCKKPFMRDIPEEKQYEVTDSVSSTLRNIQNLFDGQFFHAMKSSGKNESAIYSNADLDINTHRLQTNLISAFGKSLKLNSKFGKSLFNFRSFNAYDSIRMYLEIIDMLYEKYGWGKYIIVVPDNRAIANIYRVLRQKNGIESYKEISKHFLDSRNINNHRDYYGGGWEYDDEDLRRYKKNIEKFRSKNDLQVLLLGYNKLTYNANNENNNLGRLRLYSYYHDGKNDLDAIGQCKPIVIWDARDDKQMSKINLQYDAFNSLFGFSFNMNVVNPTLETISNNSK